MSLGKIVSLGNALDEIVPWKDPSCKDKNLAWFALPATLYSSTI